MSATTTLDKLRKAAEAAGLCTDTTTGVRQELIGMFVGSVASETKDGRASHDYSFLTGEDIVTGNLFGTKTIRVTDITRQPKFEFGSTWHVGYEDGSFFAERVVLNEHGDAIVDEDDDGNPYA